MKSYDENNATYPTCISIFYEHACRRSLRIISVSWTYNTTSSECPYQSLLIVYNNSACSAFDIDMKTGGEV